MKTFKWNCPGCGKQEAKLTDDVYFDYLKKFMNDPTYYVLCRCNRVRLFSGDIIWESNRKVLVKRGTMSSV